MYHNLNTSLASVNKEWLFKACERTVEHIKAKRIKEDEEAIEQEIKRHSSNWFNRLFGAPPLSREDAAAICGDGMMGLFFPSNYGYGSLEVANKLKRLAESCVENKVYISSQDLSCLV